MITASFLGGPLDGSFVAAGEETTSIEVPQILPSDRPRISDGRPALDEWGQAPVNITTGRYERTGATRGEAVVFVWRG